MSLLLDALKKAEEAKRQAAIATANPAEATQTTRAQPVELKLEPAENPAPRPPTPPSLPELAAHLDSVDADLATVASNIPPLRKTSAAPAPAKPKPAASPQNFNEAAERDAARNVFAAKHTPTQSRRPLWFVLAGIGVAAACIGGWLLWQLQSVGNSSLSTRPVASSATNPPPLIQTSQPIAQAQPPVPTKEMEQTAQEIKKPEPQTEKPAMATPAPAENDSPVRITRSKLRIDPNLKKAYELMQEGNIGSAAEFYEKALFSDPRNTDALLGMAAIALHKGKSTQAEAWYVRTLEADPKNIHAQAGLINLRGQTDPSFAESRLKGLLAAQPDSATLNFALGNIYAGQRRWPDAQLHYFQAHTADPTNPDYLFNLAASLDQMHLPKLALDYYQQALTAATSHRASFDTDLVKARILELKP